MATNISNPSFTLEFKIQICRMLYDTLLQIFITHVSLFTPSSKYRPQSTEPQTDGISVSTTADGSQPNVRKLCDTPPPAPQAHTHNLAYYDNIICQVCPSSPHVCAHLFFFPFFYLFFCPPYVFLSSSLHSLLCWLSSSVSSDLIFVCSGNLSVPTTNCSLQCTHQTHPYSIRNV